MNNLKTFRETIGKTQQQMASDLGVSKSLYEKIENKKRKPSREFIEKAKKKYPILDINIFFNF